MITTEADSLTCFQRHSGETHKDERPNLKQIFIQIQEAGIEVGKLFSNINLVPMLWSGWFK